MVRNRCCDCADIADFGVIIPAEQVGNIFGTHPVWTAGDHIAFKERVAEITAGDG